MFIFSSILYIISFSLYELSFVKESLLVFIAACVTFIMSIKFCYLPDKVYLVAITILSIVSGCLLVAFIAVNSLDTLFAFLVTGSVTNVLIVHYFRLSPVLSYCINYNLGVEIYSFVYRELFLPNLFINIVLACITFAMLFSIKEFRDRFLCVFKPFFYFSSICLILAGLITLSIEEDKSIGIRLVLTGFLFFSFYYSKEEIKLEDKLEEEEEEFIEV